MRLRELREDRNLLQKEVASAVGIDIEHYVSFENGTAEPDLSTLIRLADFFQCSVDELLNHSANTIEENLNVEKFSAPPQPESSSTKPENSSSLKRQACIGKFLFFLFILILAIPIWLKCDKCGYSSCKDNVEKATSREVRTSDFSVNVDYGSLTSITITVVARNDINDLELSFEFLDENEHILKSSSEVFGDFEKGESKTRNISIDFSEIININSYFCEIESGYVPLL